MKITKARLKQIIIEELEAVMKEDEDEEQERKKRKEAQLAKKKAEQELALKKLIISLLPKESLR